MKNAEITLTDNQIKKLKESFLRACADDYTGIWVLVVDTQKLLNVGYSKKIRQIVTSIIEDLLNDQLILVAWFAGSYEKKFPRLNSKEASRAN